MKTLTVVLVITVLVIHISGYLIHVPTPYVQPEKVAPVQWLHIQKLMIPLFENVCEISSNPVIRRLAEEYIPKQEDYSEDVIPNLQNLLTAGLLPKGDIFSEYNPEHMKELKIIYEVLYSAKNFDVFYKTAAWARQNLNCGLYVSAIYMSIQRRRDTERLYIPAPYELLPNYFVRKDVIVQASSILAGKEITPTEAIRDEGNAYHIDANYTAMFYDNEDDSKLAYFREDIGLNTYYFLKKLKLSPWLNDDINSRYGENMYHMMKQLMARYNLERYANGLPEIDGIKWNSLPNIPYDPELIYSDGNEFVHRTSPLELTVTEDSALLQTIENNIVAVVDHMRQSGYNKTQILNHLMEIFVTGDRSYETLARQLLGKDLTNNGQPSVLEHYMTSLRDPMFWRINKNIVDLVDSALQTLPIYSRNELYFPGVEVVNIEVKKMMTMYDYFEFDVTNALKIDNSNSTFDIKIGQPRLNHKPFAIKVNISSLITKKGLMKIYLGPKLIPGELAIKKNLFMLLDMFEINLKIGSNIISRPSDDMSHFSGDFMTLKTICKKVEDAEFGLDSLPLKTIESQIGYPSRLILPKGLSQGLPIQIFVFVAPFTKASFSDSYSTNSMEFNSAILSPGYPLDLKIEDRQLFTLPNALLKYIIVTQKGDSKVENYGGPGVTKQWYGTSTYDPSARPNYSTGNKKSFDYNSKKGPYSNAESNFPEVDKYNAAPQEVVFDERYQDEFQDKIKRKDYFDNPELIPLHADMQNQKSQYIFTDIPQVLESSKFDYFPEVDSDKPLDYIDNKLPTINDADLDFASQENVLINTPRLLKSSFDYSSKSKEPFDYKPKKGQYGKKADFQNKENYFKYHTITPVEENDSMAPPIRMPINDIDISRIENQNNIDGKIHYLLNSAKFDYSSKYKNKQPFDYKAKKAQFDRKEAVAKRKNYTNYKNDITSKLDSSDINESTSELPRVVLNEDVNNVDLTKQIADNDIYTESDHNLDDVQDTMRSLAHKEPILNMIKKRTPTVYDFLFPTFDYEDYKVYE